MTDPVNQTRLGGVDSWLGRLGFALLLPRCLICNERGANGMDLCASCHDSLPYNRACCARCAMPTAIATEACGRCLRRPPPQGLTRAAFVYRAPLDRLLPRAKFHGDLSSALLLARLMARELADAERPQALVPVPLHRDRLRRRGYDQALELARPLAHALGLPLRDGLLRRIRATAPQSRLAAPQRRRNLRGAFAVWTEGNLPAHVALVDDVMTTGATVEAAAAALRRAGVARVDVWVCARVP